MAALNELFALEVEFHRRLRLQATGRAEAASIHTSYALQSGYEQLLGQIGSVQPRDLDRLAEVYVQGGDARDGQAARDSIMRLMGFDEI